MKKTTKHIVTSALIAALYALLTYLSSALNLAYGPIQFRISEALIVLAAFTPTAIPGLTIGCILGNITSPYGVLDIALGSFATLLATVVCYYFGKKFKKQSPYIFPIIVAFFNALIIGLEIAIFTPGNAFFTAFIISALEVGLGELAVCYILGVPLYLLIDKRFKNLL